jgi:hypothetical protein
VLINITVSLAFVEISFFFPEKSFLLTTNTKKGVVSMAQDKWKSAGSCRKLSHSEAQEGLGFYHQRSLSIWFKALAQKVPV